MKIKASYTMYLFKIHCTTIHLTCVISIIKPSQNVYKFLINSKVVIRVTYTKFAHFWHVEI